jgi:hypothetical protein
MLRKLFLAALVVLVLPFTTAQAGVRIGVGVVVPIHRGYYRPYYYGPSVGVGFYYAPAPVYYYTPAPVYVTPVVPTPVYIQPVQPFQPAPLPPALNQPAAPPQPAPVPAPDNLLPPPRPVPGK